MGVEGDYDECFDVVFLNLGEGFFGEGVPVAHSDVGFGCDVVALVEGFGDEVSLGFGVAEDGGSAADGFVGGAGFGGAAFGDYECD